MQTRSDVAGFRRHIDACRNAVLPGTRLPFRLGAAQVGWVAPKLAAALAAFPQITATETAISLSGSSHFPAITKALSDAGQYRWRREAFDVRAEPDGPVLATLDRGALPAFGVVSVGAHLNGLVPRADGPHLWVARRAANKTLDPNKLDHIVAGGVPAGLTPAQCLIKECAEEAAIPEHLAARARFTGIITYTMERPEGLRRDRLHCYDLELPEDFVPHPADGEVQEFFLWPLARVAEAVRDTDDFKFNVNLVLIDLLIRYNVIQSEPLRQALHVDTETA